VRRVVDARGHAVRLEGLPGAPRESNFQPFEPAVAQRLRGMMLQVVDSPSGTAYRAFHRDGAPRLPGITVGGKTGTAELDVRVTTKSGRRATVRRQHAWFVGFAQKEDEAPVRTLAFVVLVEQVRGRQTGGQICAPVARDLVAQVLRPTESARRPQGEQWLERLADQGRRALGEWLTGPHSPLPSPWRKRE
jgi:cell division protein FtsI/penicillin-binding protein 2